MTDRSDQAQSFDTEAGYAAAIDKVLAATRETIWVFDGDLTRMALEQAARCAALGVIVASRPESRLRIVLHDPRPLERSSPRLLQLLRLHSDRIEVRQTPKPLRHLSDCFLLGDVGHGVVRFHALHARGKYFIDSAADLQPWRQRFEALWESATPCLAVTRLGL